MIDVLQQVPPRHRHAAPGDAQTEFSLYIFTKRGAFDTKQAVNSQVGPA